MDATATAAGQAPIRITDTEATIIGQTINGYMQGPTHRGRLEIFDRKKGANVLLRLDRIVSDDPARIAFPAPMYWGARFAGLFPARVQQALTGRWPGKE